MSVQGATIKRLEFLMSRWDYDIPHKFVWALDIYGVGKAAIDKILQEYERRDSRHWPVAQQISIEAVRRQLGFVGLAQTVDFPTESMNIEIAEVENRGGYIPGIAGSTRNAYGSQQTIQVTFLETNIDILDYFIKPWLIATSHKGLIEDGDPTTNVKATMEAYLYGRAEHRNSVPTLRKHITFYGCTPIAMDPDQVSYGNLGYNDITRKAVFTFQRYVINNINAEQTPPEVTVPIRPIPQPPPPAPGIPIYATK